MRYVCLVIALSVAAFAQSQPDARAAMEASLEKQRASVRGQLASATGKTPPPSNSFFTVPWVDAAAVVPQQQPLCDPMPAPQLDSLIEENAKKEDLKPELIRAVINQESGNRPCALSPKGAQGLMQLMPQTAAQFGVEDAFDPKQNVEAGAKLLKQLLGKYKNDVSLALSAYNAGSDRVDREGGIPNIPETMNYVNEIVSKLPKQ